MKSVSLRLPYGLYCKAEKLAKDNKLSLHAYLVRMIWQTTKWDGGDTKPTKS